MKTTQNKIFSLLLSITLFASQTLSIAAVFLAPPSIDITFETENEDSFDAAMVNEIIAHSNEDDDEVLWEKINLLIDNGKVSEAIYVILNVRQPEKCKNEEEKIKYIQKKKEILNNVENMVTANPRVIEAFKSRRYQPPALRLKKLLEPADFNYKENHDVLLAAGNVLAKVGVVSIPLFIAEYFILQAPQGSEDEAIKDYLAISNNLLANAATDQNRWEAVFTSGSRMIKNERIRERNYFTNELFFTQLFHNAPDPEVALKQFKDLAIDLTKIGRDIFHKLAKFIARQIGTLSVTGVTRGEFMKHLLETLIHYDYIVEIGRALLSVHTPNHANYCEELIVDLAPSVEHACELASYYVEQHYLTGKSREVIGLMKKAIPRILADETNAENPIPLEMAMRLRILAKKIGADIDKITKDRTVTSL